MQSMDLRPMGKKNRIEIMENAITTIHTYHCVYCVYLSLSVLEQMSREYRLLMGMRLIIDASDQLMDSRIHLLIKNLKRTSARRRHQRHMGKHSNIPSSNAIYPT